MADFAWTSANEIGHAGIDDQHRQLFALAAHLAKPLVDGVDRKPNPKKLRALLDFSSEHFKYEESLMRDSRYPHLKRHAKYHAALITELKIYCARLDRGVSADPASFVEFLWNWLLVHIDTADRELVKWLKADRRSNANSPQ